MSSNTIEKIRQNTLIMTTCLKMLETPKTTNRIPNMSVTRFIYRQGEQRIQRAALLDELKLKIDRKAHQTNYIHLRAENILRRTESMSCRHGPQQLLEYTVEKDDSHQD